MIYVIHWFVNILTLGLVSIATITTTTYHVDEPITELNNQSLNEVFLDGNLVQNHNFSDGINNWTLVRVGSYTVNENLFSYIGNAQYAEVYQPVVFIPNDYFYSWSIVKSNSNQVNSSRSGISRVFHSGSGLFENLSAKWTWASGNYWTERISDHRTTNFDEIQIKSMGRINLTNLGIDNLTKNDLDDWYDIYVQANANNGIYIESTSHLNNNIHLVDVSVMVISFAFWVWLFKFLKGVIF